MNRTMHKAMPARNPNQPHMLASSVLNWQSNKITLNSNNPIFMQHNPQIQNRITCAHA